MCLVLGVGAGLGLVLWLGRTWSRVPHVDGRQLLTFDLWFMTRSNFTRDLSGCLSAPGLHPTKVVIEPRGHNKR